MNYKKIYDDLIESAKLRPKEDISKYDQSIWINPYTYRCLTNNIEIKCKVCGKIGRDNSTFKRWHFNNCRGIK